MRFFTVIVLLSAAVLWFDMAQGPAWAQQSSSGGSAGDVASADSILLPVENTPEPIPRSHHPDIEYYASGEVKIRREINLLSDESAVNHGPYTEFYESGGKFAEGRFENGVRVGDWTYWFENGTECKTVQYRDGVPDGEWTVYREDGTRKATRRYENGEPDGTWITYGADGQTAVKEENYEDGLAHGKWVQRFESGKPHIEEHFQRGKRDGNYTEWDEAGNVVREMAFKEGRLDGRVVARAANGREIVQYYRDGQLVPDGPDAGGQ